jgi:hypothetical protein
MRAFLSSYLDEMRRTIHELEESEAVSASQLDVLIARHLAQTAAFCHERLIHLLVTFFFAFLFVVAIVGTLILPDIPLYVLDGILLITLLFYIRHYYFLENHTQKLYIVTERLFRLKSAN